jgi:hypothetical protein
MTASFALTGAGNAFLDETSSQLPIIQAIFHFPDSRIQHSVIDMLFSGKPHKPLRFEYPHATSGIGVNILYNTLCYNARAFAFAYRR